MVGASPINYDYNIIDFARDVSPVGAAMNMSSALREGDYKTAGLNAALLGAEVLPIGKLAGPLVKRVLRDKDMLIPALTDKDYAQLVARETLMGKGPLAGKSVGALSMDELAAKRAEIMKQATEDYGERMGVTVHSTNFAGPLGINNFRWRKPNIPGKSNEPGIFTHSPLDPTEYGQRKFAVLYKAKPGNFVAGKQDTESGFSEIFIPERAVEDIFEID